MERKRERWGLGCRAEARTEQGRPLQTWGGAGGGAAADGEGSPKKEVMTSDEARPRREEGRVWGRSACHLGLQERRSLLRTAREDCHTKLRLRGV